MSECVVSHEQAVQKLLSYIASFSASATLDASQWPNRSILVTAGTGSSCSPDHVVNEVLHCLFTSNGAQLQQMSALSDTPQISKPTAHGSSAGENNASCEPQIPKKLATVRVVEPPLLDLMELGSGTVSEETMLLSVAVPSRFGPSPWWRKAFSTPTFSTSCSINEITVVILRDIDLVVTPLTEEEENEEDGMADSRSAERTSISAPESLAEGVLQARLMAAMQHLPPWTLVVATTASSSFSHQGELGHADMFLPLVSRHKFQTTPLGYLLSRLSTLVVSAPTPSSRISVGRKLVADSVKRFFSFWNLPDGESKEQVAFIDTFDEEFLLNITAGCGSVAGVRDAVLRQLGQYKLSQLYAEEQITGTLLVAATSSSELAKAPQRLFPLSAPTVSNIVGLQTIQKQLHRLLFLPGDVLRTLQQKRIPAPAGVLLFGIPGTGKTMLARELAEQLQGGFLSIDVPRLVHGAVGESERTLRELFREARRRAPCVVFLDEVQAMFHGAHQSSNTAQKRWNGTGVETGSSNMFMTGDTVSSRAPLLGRDFHEQRLVTMFANEIDECCFGQLVEEEEEKKRSSDASSSIALAFRRVLIVAATNVPQLIAPELLRPGRLDIHFHVPSPPLKQILELAQRIILKEWLELEENVVKGVLEGKGDNDDNVEVDPSLLGGSGSLGFHVLHQVKATLLRAFHQGYAVTGADVRGLLRQLAVQITALSFGIGKTEEQQTVRPLKALMNLSAADNDLVAVAIDASLEHFRPTSSKQEEEELASWRLAES